MSKKMQRRNIGVAIIAAVAAIVLGALGWVFWQNVLADPITNLVNKATDRPTTDYSITRGSDDMDTYTNKTLGFSFEFPHAVSGYTGCKQGGPILMQYPDGSEIEYVDHVAVEGMAEMTVLTGDTLFTIAPKRVPVMTVSWYGDEQTRYHKSCDMQKTTQKLLQEFKDTPSEGDYIEVLAEHRSFVVQKLASEDELKTAWKHFEGVDTNVFADAAYTLEDDTNADRKRVNYTYVTRDGGVPDMLGGKMDVWYYPAQKLVVSFAYGQAQPFVYDGDKSYLEAVLQSFKTL